MCSCTCGILSIMLNQRWRLFRQPIIANPKSVVAYTKAAVAMWKMTQHKLYNYTNMSGGMIKYVEK